MVTMNDRDRPATRLVLDRTGPGHVVLNVEQPELLVVGASRLPARTRGGWAPPSPRPLYPGQPALSVQATANVDNAAVVASVAVAGGIGAVYSTQMKMRGRKKRVKDLLARHADVGGDATTVVFDASCYAGKNRDVGVRELDREWIRFQLAQDLPYAYTDSPYLPAGDRPALLSVLTQTVKMKLPVVAVLALALDWLKKSRERQYLIDQVNRAGVPIAVVLEHEKDPLGIQAAVVGLVDVLAQVDVAVILLRSDVSAIGAVALGAAMGAVGTRSGQRHLFPRKPGRGGSRGEHISLFVPYAMSYRRLDTLAAAMAKAPDEQSWFTCDCPECAGRNLAYVDTHERAYSHSISALGVLAGHVLQDPTVAPTAWLSRCTHEQHVNLELESRLRSGWPVPDFLGAWQVALPAPNR